MREKQEGKKGVLANANIDLARANLVSNLVDGGEPRRALAIDGVDGGFDGDASVQRRHASGGGASPWRKNVADRDVFDELGVQADLGVGCAQDVGEDELGLGVLEPSLPAL